MKPDSLCFQIVSGKGCPHYQGLDKFDYANQTLVMPGGKPVCMILMRTVIRFLDQLDSKEPVQPVSISCDGKPMGCPGVIKLGVNPDSNKIKPVSDRLSGENAATLNLLKTIPMFAGLGKQKLAELIDLLNLEDFKHLQFKSFSKGDVIIEKGTLGTHLYIVFVGKVEVLGEKGNVISVIQKGEVFGEMSLISGNPVGANIRAADSTSVIAISAKNFSMILSQFPSLQMYFIRLLAYRLAQSNVERSQEFSQSMSGQLVDLPTDELLQTLNMNKKTGVLTLNFATDSARISFKDGNILSAHYKDKQAMDAFIEILQQKEGRFVFHPELPLKDKALKPLGNFMSLLMEGLRIMDEMSSV